MFKRIYIFKYITSMHTRTDTHTRTNARTHVKTCTSSSAGHAHTRTCNHTHACTRDLSFRSLCLLLFPSIFSHLCPHTYIYTDTHTFTSLSFSEASPSLSFLRTPEKWPKLVHGRVRNCFWTGLYGEERKRWSDRKSL